MSFASNVKAELCRLAVHKKCCAVAECFGILLFGNTCSATLIKIVTESPDFAARLPKLFWRAFHVEFDEKPAPQSAGKSFFQLLDPEKIASVYSAFGFDAASSVALHVNYGVLEDECCRVAFARGAFLAGGSVTDPGKTLSPGADDDPPKGRPGDGRPAAGVGLRREAHQPRRQLRAVF